MEVEAAPRLREQKEAFLDYLENWQADLLPLPLESLLAEAEGPEHVAIFCVDIINGFCTEGPLASDRVQSIVAPIAQLFTRAHAAGIRQFVLPQDAHDPAAVEFLDYPPHCIRGTSEAETAPELASLPFAPQFHVFPKNSLHSALETGLDAWLDANPQITHRIVVGDCTDLCTYHLAMHLKLRANARNETYPVILPADCVSTYDIPIEVAQEAGIPAHPADIIHEMFLYSMVTNGIRVVSSLI